MRLTVTLSPGQVDFLRELLDERHGYETNKGIKDLVLEIINDAREQHACRKRDEPE